MILGGAPGVARDSRGIRAARTVSFWGACAAGRRRGAAPGDTRDATEIGVKK